MRQNEWWKVAALCSGLSALLVGLLAMLPSGWLKNALLIAVAVFLFVLQLNPVRRFFRVFWSVFGFWCSATIIPTFRLEVEAPQFLAKILTDGPPALFHVCVLALAALALVLDWLQDWRERNVSATSDLDLDKDLDTVNETVKKLDSKFIDLIGRFADEDVLCNSRLRRDLIRETGRYLGGRELLPCLITIHGKIKSASEDSHLESKHPGLCELLGNLAGKIKEYRGLLGEEGGPTGVGRDALKRLLEEAKKIEHGQGVQEILDLAENARRYPYHKFSEEMQFLIGQIQKKIR